MSLVTIGSICSFFKGASIPRARMSKSGDYLYLHYGDLYKGHDTYINVNNPQSDIPFISNVEKLKEEQFVEDGDIIYILTSETIEDLGKALMVINPDKKEVVSGTETTIMKVIDKQAVEPRWLNYLLQTDYFKQLLRQYVTGMKVFRVHPRDISRIVIELPPINIQRKIVEILDSINSLIQINLKLNDYLAETADSLFINTFGHLEENAVLSDIANITMGQSPMGASYNNVGNGVIFYQGRGEFGWRFPTRRLFTTEPKRMAKAGDILMSVRAPVGDLNIAYEDCCIGRGLAAINCSYPSFCLYLMRSLCKKLSAYNSEGTVFGSINSKDLKNIEIALPNVEDIIGFEDKVVPIDNLIKFNEIENRNLSQLRDMLLSKLMSS